MITLRCCALPDKSLPYKNALFVNPNEANLSSVSHVVIHTSRDAVYPLLTHEQIMMGCVGANKLQRRALNLLETGEDPLYLTPIDVLSSRQSRDIKLIRFEVSKFQNRQMTVEEETLIDEIYDKFTTSYVKLSLLQLAIGH
jgi:hypothetical protein